MASSFLYRPIAGRATAVCRGGLQWRASTSSFGASSGDGQNQTTTAHPCIRGRLQWRASTSGSGGHFPWRHQSILPERFDERDDLSGMPNNFRARFLRRFLACRELDLSLLDAVPLPFGYAHEWEEDMADHFATAFGLALAELLRSVFRGAVVVKNDGGISIDSSITAEPGESGLVENAYLRQMMDKALVEQYKSVDPDKLHLKLSMRPIDAELQSMFVVPMLSRDIVEKKPQLKGAYLKIEQAFAETKSAEEVKRMTYDLAREIGQADVYKRTVVADASITCSEFFQVRHASTEVVLQGMHDDEEEEETVHNVRFECVTERVRGETERTAGNWKVIDLDDMLDGNSFH